MGGEEEVGGEEGIRGEKEGDADYGEMVSGKGKKGLSGKGIGMRGLKILAV